MKTSMVVSVRKLRINTKITKKINVAKKRNKPTGNYKHTVNDLKKKKISILKNKIKP